jgi:hypothetical protein
MRTTADHCANQFAKTSRHWLSVNCSHRIVSRRLKLSLTMEVTPFSWPWVLESGLEAIWWREATWHPRNGKACGIYRHLAFNSDFSPQRSLWAWFQPEIIEWTWNEGILCVGAWQVVYLLESKLRCCSLDDLKYVGMTELCGDFVFPTSALIKSSGHSESEQISNNRLLKI